MIAVTYSLRTSGMGMFLKIASGRAPASVAGLEQSPYRTGQDLYNTSTPYSTTIVQCTGTEISMSQE